MTISSVVDQDCAVIIPNEATFVLLNEPTQGQDGWACFQKEYPRMSLEAGNLDIHHVHGGSSTVGGSALRLTEFAKLVGRRSRTQKDFQKTERESRRAHLRTARTGQRRSRASADAIVYQGLDGSAAAAFGAVAAFAFGAEVACV